MGKVSGCRNSKCQHNKRKRSKRTYQIPEDKRKMRHPLLIQHLQNKRLCADCAQYVIFKLDFGVDPEVCFNRRQENSKYKTFRICKCLRYLKGQVICPDCKNKHKQNAKQQGPKPTGKRPLSDYKYVNMIQLSNNELSIILQEQFVRSSAVMTVLFSQPSSFIPERNNIQSPNAYQIFDILMNPENDDNVRNGGQLQTQINETQIRNLIGVNNAQLDRQESSNSEMSEDEQTTNSNVEVSPPARQSKRKMQKQSTQQQKKQTLQKSRQTRQLQQQEKCQVQTRRQARDSQAQQLVNNPQNLAKKGRQKSKQQKKDKVIKKQKAQGTSKNNKQVPRKQNINRVQRYDAMPFNPQNVQQLMEQIDCIPLHPGQQQEQPINELGQMQQVQQISVNNSQQQVQQQAVSQAQDQQGIVQPQEQQHLPQIETRNVNTKQKEGVIQDLTETQFSSCLEQQLLNSSNDKTQQNVVQQQDITKNASLELQERQQQTQQVCIDQTRADQQQINNQSNANSKDSPVQQQKEVPINEMPQGKQQDHRSLTPVSISRQETGNDAANLPIMSQPYQLYTIMIKDPQQIDLLPQPAKYTQDKNDKLVQQPNVKSHQTTDSRLLLGQTEDSTDTVENISQNKQDQDEWVQQTNKVDFINLQQIVNSITKTYPKNLRQSLHNQLPQSKDLEPMEQQFQDVHQDIMRMFFELKSKSNDNESPDLPLQQDPDPFQRHGRLRKYLDVLKQQFSKHLLFADVIQEDSVDLEYKRDGLIDIKFRVIQLKNPQRVSEVLGETLRGVYQKTVNNNNTDQPQATIEQYLRGDIKVIDKFTVEKLWAERLPRKGIIQAQVQEHKLHYGILKRYTNSVWKGTGFWQLLKDAYKNKIRSKYITDITDNESVTQAVNSILPQNLKSNESDSVFQPLKIKTLGVTEPTLYQLIGRQLAITPYHQEPKLLRSINIGCGDFIVQPLSTDLNLQRFIDIFSQFFKETGGFLRMMQYIPLEVFLAHDITMVVHLREPHETSIVDLGLRSNHCFITYSGLSDLGKDHIQTQNLNENTSIKSAFNPFKSQDIVPILVYDLLEIAKKQILGIKQSKDDEDTWIEKGLLTLEPYYINTGKYFEQDVDTNLTYAFAPVIVVRYIESRLRSKTQQEPISQQEAFEFVAALYCIRGISRESDPQSNDTNDIKVNPPKLDQVAVQQKWTKDGQCHFFKDYILSIVTEVTAQEKFQKHQITQVDECKDYSYAEYDSKNGLFLLKGVTCSFSTICSFVDDKIDELCQFKLGCKPKCDRYNLFLGCLVSLFTSISKDLTKFQKEQKERPQIKKQFKQKLLDFENIQKKLNGLQEASI